jgi:hypothetical protein
MSGDEKSSGDELMSEVVLGMLDFKGWKRYCSESMWVAKEHQGQRKERRRTTIRDAIRKKDKRQRATARDTHHVMPEYKRDPMQLGLPFVTNQFIRCFPGEERNLLTATL